MGDKVRVGLTDHAQKQLGDLVFVDLPQAGTRLDASEPFGSVESVKAASEVYMPVAGTVAAVNDELNGEPELVNSDPYGDGWMIEITLSDKSQVNGLLTAVRYEEYVRGESGD